MRKLNTFLSIPGFLLLIGLLNLLPTGKLTASEPVRINFLYVASTVTNVNRDTVPGWNTVSFHQAWHSRSGLTNLKDISGASTSIGVKVSGDFFGYNSSGASSTTLGMVDLVSKTNYYGNTASPGAITLSGLNPNSNYKISIFGSRNGTTSNADVVYTLNDANSTTLTLSCANNITGLAIFNNIKPNADGTLSVSLSKGSANTIGYTYLAAVQLEETDSQPVDFAPVLINFGPAAVQGWNTLTTYSTSGAALSNMLDTQNNATNLSLKITTGFYGIIGTTGMGSTVTSLSMPDSVSKSNMFKNGDGGAFAISGMDPAKKYKFTIFGSRGGLTEARDVVYTVNDEPGSSVTLDVANNATNVAVLDNISPNADGSLTFTLNFGSNNSAYTYINAMKIDTATMLTGLAENNSPSDKIRTQIGEGSVVLNWDSSDTNTALVRVYNAQGKQLQNISVSGSSSLTLNLPEKGLYMVQVKTSKANYFTKFIN